MPLYALATIPLINRLSSVPDVKQIWYADDASASGRLSSIRNWWDNLLISGPSFCYHANAHKTWLITKEQYLPQAREQSEVNITPHGRPYLGAPLGTDKFCVEFVQNKLMKWQEELALLVDVATSQPHATYAAFIHGFTHKFTYLSRTTPNKDHLLEPLEQFIRSKLIPAWTGRAPPNDLERELFALPERLGGLGIVDLVGRSHKEFQASVSISLMPSYRSSAIRLSVGNHGCPNGSQAKCTQAETRGIEIFGLQHQQLLGMGPGWTLRPTVFGVDALRGLISM